jgi:predicted flap endonuclease-1-like 5' DNA nuclease/FtsZ-binding cell division protein ZapB
MSFGPRRGGFGIGRDEPFRVDELDRVERERLDEEEVAEIETVVRERDELIASLQTDLVEIQGERDALTRRIDQLEQERDGLRDRIEGFEAERPMLEPDALFTEFGDALASASAELGGSNYSLSNLQVDLKTSIVNTGDGLRFQLLGSNEPVVGETVSTLHFGLSPGETVAETEYVEVPDLRFADRDDAEETIRRAGLTVGSVELAESDEEPGTVLEQFPSPFSLAVPETPVDLVVVDDELEQVIDERDVTDREPEPARKPTVVDVEGVGETFQRRLERAGIDSVADLAATDPRELAKVLDTGLGRAETIVEHAKSLLS